MISADGAMYASKRAGKDRVMGVPMPTWRAPRPSVGVDVRWSVPTPVQDPV